MTPGPPNALADLIRERFSVEGVVQGVGFRPFVYRLAMRHGLCGHVRNTRNGVQIEVEGSVAAVEAFAGALETSPPAHARISRLRREPLRPILKAGFSVLESDQSALPSLRVPPDLATCSDCLAELTDAHDRRYAYPFTNCTECGPRYTIVEGLPYDRVRTTMRNFPLCPACEAEYLNPADRRFHAEPVACPVCGPRLCLWSVEGDTLAEDGKALDLAADALRGGSIVAMKGLGGYHLMADATDAAAVARLRDRKQRPSKPFAVMVASVAEARSFAEFTAEEETLIQSPAAPIVLAARRESCAIAEPVAPACAELGLMLAYTPLHHLLLARVNRPLVATSGNDGGEPILFGDRPAWIGLRESADLFLGHNRQIRRPAEDSVARVLDGAPQVLRLGRGLAPDSIALPPAIAPDGPAVLGLGGHLKTAPVLLRGQEAILAPHIGDLDTLAAEEAFARAIEDLQALHGCKAEAVACDLHPDYATTHLAEAFGLPVVSLQHHVAHVVSVIAEHGLAEPVLGFAWDGTGYGMDGTVWGGETLLVARGGWQRRCRLRPFVLPGGEQAIREPRRALLGMLHTIGRPDLLPHGLFEDEERRLLFQMLDAELNAPVTSSAGRVLDAMAVLLGLTPVCRHEGEAAMQLERTARAARGNAVSPYPCHLAEAEGDRPMEVDWEPMLLGLARDRKRGTPPAVLARKAYETMAMMVAAVARRFDTPSVALTGGCFQSRLLSERCLSLLREDDRSVYWNRRVPPGDGGLALGQSLAARWQLADGG